MTTNPEWSPRLRPRKPTSVESPIINNRNRNVIASPSSSKKSVSSPLSTSAKRDRAIVSSPLPSSPAKKQRTPISSPGGAKLQSLQKTPIFYGTPKGNPVRRSTHNSTKNLPQSVQIFKGFIKPRFEHPPNYILLSNEELLQPYLIEEPEENASVESADFFLTKSFTINMLLREACRHWHLSIGQHELRDEFDRVWPVHCFVLDELAYRFAADPSYRLVLVKRLQRSPWITHSKPSIKSQPDDHNNEDHNDNEDHHVHEEDDHDTDDQQNDHEKGLFDDDGYFDSYQDHFHDEDGQPTLDDSLTVEERTANTQLAIDQELLRLAPVSNDTRRSRANTGVASRLIEFCPPSPPIQSPPSPIIQTPPSPIIQSPPSPIIQTPIAQASSSQAHVDLSPNDLFSSSPLPPLVQAPSQTDSLLAQKVATLEAERKRYQSLLSGLQKRHWLAESSEEPDLTPESLALEIHRWERERDEQLERIQTRERELAEERRRLSQEDRASQMLRRDVQRLSEELERLMREQEVRVRELEKERAQLQEHLERERQLAESLESASRQNASNLAQKTAAETQLAEIGEQMAEKEARLLELANSEREESARNLQKLRQKAQRDYQQVQRELAALQSSFDQKTSEINLLLHAEHAHQQRESQLVESLQRLSQEHADTQQRKLEAEQRVTALAESLRMHESQLAVSLQPQSASEQTHIADAPLYIIKEGGEYADPNAVSVDLKANPITKLSGSVVRLASGAFHQGPLLEAVHIPDVSLQTRSVYGGDTIKSVVIKEGGEMTYALSTHGLLSEWSSFHPERPLLVLQPDRSFTKISCGRDFAVALTKHGQAFSWGSGRDGKLGHGTAVISVATPQLIQGLVGHPIKTISCGQEHTLALTRHQGCVFSWGDGEEGKLGLGDTGLKSEWKPRRVPGLSHIVKISAAAFHSAGLDEAGQLYCWGLGKYGQLGTGSRENRLSPTKVTLISHHPFVRVKCSNLFTVVLDSSGDVFAFGMGMAGESEASSEYSLVDLAPFPRCLLSQKNIVKIGVSNSEIFALPGIILGSQQDLPIEL